MLLLLVLVPGTVRAGACLTSADCGDLTRVCRSHICTCRPGYIEWKWECHKVLHNHVFYCVQR